MKRKVILLLLGCLLGGTPIVLYAQSVTISGTVTDAESQQPLPGVSVLEKDSQRGTMTDENGRFEIELSQADVYLVFSSIGYATKEVHPGQETSLAVQLEPDLQSLDQVVVVGYGTQTKRYVTGSVTSVETEELEMQPNTNIAQALRGDVAGVQFLDNGRPGQNGSILIRGTRSITAGNEPLIVLDGAFYNGALADINPNDIASLEVLKDASAAAIYGSRAANGVILITSKKGVSEKPTIRFNAYYGVSGWSNKMQLYSPESYLQRRLDFRAQNEPGAEPVPVRDLLTPVEREMYDAGKTVDPWDAISQDASQQSYNISVAGRTDRTNYFISGSYADEDGLIYGDRADRTSLRLNLDNQITDWLKLGVSSQYTRRDLSGVTASVLDAYWMSPYSKMYFDEAETDPVMPTPSGDDLIGNPMFNALQRDNEQISNNLFANIYAEIDFPFLEGLSYRFNYSPNVRWDHNYTFQNIYQRNGINNTGWGRKYNRNRWDWQFENILSYTKSVGDHSFDVTLLYGRNHSSWEDTFTEGEGFVNGANGWNNLDIAQTQTIETAASGQDGVSSMARLNYNFKDRYLLTLTARRDGTSVFGADKKYGVFPSMALGWILSDEPFMQTASGIELLKLRFSYGEVGNQAVSPYQSLERSASQQYVFGGETYTAIFPDPSVMANSDLGWETTRSLNAAVDFSLWQGRVGGTLEYYNMHTTDLLLARSLPGMTGFESTMVNLGETSNKGLEVTLNTVNIRSERLEWGSTITFSTNRNRIEHLYYSDSDGDGVEDDDLGNRWFIGHPIGVTYDYVFDGIYQEGDELPEGYQPGWIRVKDLDGDGEITTADRTVIGQTQPKYRWGFSSYLNYQGFSLNFTISGMQGWESQFNLLDVGTQTGVSYPGRSINFLDAGYWTPENRSEVRPGLSYTNPLAMGYYLDRDFVRLQDVTLSYNFPTSILDKIGLSSLRIYVSGRNLATFTDWLGPDPESGYNNVTNLYPTPRTIVGGLNLSL